MLPVRLINTADCYNLVLHLRFVSGSLTEINWSVAASCGLMLPVTSDLFGGFYWSCALFTALLGFICPGENRGENAHLLHLNTQCSTQHNTTHRFTDERVSYQDNVTNPSSLTDTGPACTLYLNTWFLLSRYCWSPELDYMSLLWERFRGLKHLTVL